MEETRNTELKPIKMALGLQNDLILFERRDAGGLYLGVEKEYETIGTYTGDLLKICENEENYIFYSLHDIITQADKPEHQNKLKLVYCILQMEPEQIKEITNRIEKWEGWPMALHFDNLEALKQAFKEQEENEEAKAKTAAEADSIKAERLKLDQRKQRHKEQQDKERLKLLQEKEQRAKAKEEQQAKQVKNDNKAYLISLLLTFGSLLGSVLLFILILLRY